MPHHDRGSTLSTALFININTDYIKTCYENVKKITGCHYSEIVQIGNGNKNMKSLMSCVQIPSEKAAATLKCTALVAY